MGYSAQSKLTSGQKGCLYSGSSDRGFCAIDDRREGCCGGEGVLVCFCSGLGAVSGAGTAAGDGDEAGACW